MTLTQGQFIKTLGLIHGNDGCFFGIYFGQIFDFSRICCNSQHGGTSNSEHDLLNYVSFCLWRDDATLLGVLLSSVPGGISTRIERLELILLF